MIPKLTPDGEAAVLGWMRAVRRDVDDCDPAQWIKYANKQLSLCDTSFDGQHRISLRGSVTSCGHLKSLVLRPSWFKALPFSSRKNLIGA